MDRLASDALLLAPGGRHRRAPPGTLRSPARGAGRARTAALAALVAMAASACASGQPPAPPPARTADGPPRAEGVAGGPPAPGAPSASAPAPGAPEPGTPPPGDPASSVPAAPRGAAPVDPVDLLWGHRLAFSRRGQPLVTIRLMEGQEEIAFRPRGPARLVLRGGGAVDVPAGARLTVRALDAVPAALVRHVLLADAPIAHRERLEPLRRAWQERGVPVASKVVGGVYGIRGRVVDNRRELLLADGGPGTGGAVAAREGRSAGPGGRTTPHLEVVARPRGTLELRSEGGAPLGEADSALWMDVADGAGFVVEGVEHERSPSARAREDRSYGGRLYVTVDAAGRLAAIHAVELEELLRGIVPSEIPASSHREALKAQAVAARSNVLAQIGTRHLTDPFMLCAEVHCQAYRGDAARTARTDEAIRATRGEVVFASADRTLVDAVYSAMCGGHGESNEHVWGNARSPSLRGRPDLPAAQATRWKGGLADEERLRAFLAAPPPDAWCRRPRAARQDRFRWERRLTRAELERALAPLGVGAVRAIRVGARGVSGRARVLEVEGDAGRTELSGELRIRRLLGNLPSAMFLVEPSGDGGVVLRGGGWGHGAGMCQWGAVGRAEAGQGYREILRAYYSGAEVAAVY